MEYKFVLLWLTYGDLNNSRLGSIALFCADEKLRGQNKHIKL